MQRSLLSLAVLAAAAATLSACGGSAAPTASTTPPNVTTSVVSVTPTGGATNVPTSTGITIMFDHPMMVGMEAYVALHQNSLTGAAVAGTATWSNDHMQLLFTPDSALLPNTTYVLHMGGGMVDANDRPVNYQQCPAFGAQSVTGSMMSGGGMMGGGTGSEMGSGWKGSDGDYGMEFVFTTS